MSLGTPLALLLLLAIPAAWLLARHRARRLRIRVSSLIPWDPVPSGAGTTEARGGLPPSFAWQAGAIALLALTAADPAGAGAGPGRTVGVVLDRSLRTGASQGEPLRRAVAAASPIIGGLDGVDTVRIAAVPPLESDRPAWSEPRAPGEALEELRSLAAREPADGPPTWREALPSLRATLGPGAVLVLTDRPVAGPPPGVAIVSGARPLPNRGIVRLRADPDAAGDDGMPVFAEARAYGGATLEGASLELRGEGWSGPVRTALHAEETGVAVARVLERVPASPWIEARLVGPEEEPDALPADDRAGWRRAGRTGLRALVAHRDRPSIRRALEASGLTVRVTDGSPSGGGEVVVLPPDAPAPPPSTLLVARVGRSEDGRPVEGTARLVGPLARGLEGELAAVRVRRASPLPAPPGGRPREPLLRSAAGEILADLVPAGPGDEPAILRLPFDPAGDSDWTGRPSFPVLWAALVDRVAPSPAPRADLPPPPPGPAASDTGGRPTAADALPEEGGEAPRPTRIPFAPVVAVLAGLLLGLEAIRRPRRTARPGSPGPVGDPGPRMP